ncbi:MAG: homoserine dehydrogenase [Clostridium sp.]|nr:homoserine dehydrogenase [Clostridium sp.]
MINIGLLGLGNVASGVVEILEKRKDEIYKLVGKNINIKKILVKDIDKKRDVDIDKDKLTTSFDEILKDDEISIILELTSALEESYDYIKLALKNKKSVVTANKAVVSKYFEELSSLADENKLSFLYEASVGGGIPIIKPLKEELVLNKISEVKGILNGTCNYILTNMFEKGLEYDAVLKKAQELGYAEMDPSADVKGDDTLRKLRILGTLALQGRVQEKDIILEGIDKITLFDIEKVKAMDSTVKLIGEIKELEGAYYAIVMPTIVKKDSYFAGVNMAYNSVSFNGDNVGELKFYGSGAGKLPTGDAVIRDLLDIVLDYDRKNNPLGDRVLENRSLDFKGKYYLRISDSEEKTLKLLDEISGEIISNTAIITKEIKYKHLMDKISDLDINEDKYFIARILD